MGCRPRDADSIDTRPFQPDPFRRVVLLAIEDDDVRARFAYQLTASGFNVVTDVAVDVHDAHRPDVIVTELTATRPSGGAPIGVVPSDERSREIPVVAVADEVSDTTRSLARHEGCAAVCLATCSAAALAAGIQAILDRR